MLMYRHFVSPTNQKELHQRFMALLKRKAYATYGLGVAMGLSPEIIDRFMIDCLPVSFKALTKIEMFCVVLEDMLEHKDRITVAILKERIRDKLAQKETK